MLLLTHFERYLPNIDLIVCQDTVSAVMFTADNWFQTAAAFYIYD